MGMCSSERITHTHLMGMVFSFFYCFTASAATSVGVSAYTLEKLKKEILTAEKDLFRSQEKHNSTRGQLKKIKKLHYLQQKEVEFSKAKIKDLNASLEDLSSQKKDLLKKIADHKKSLRQNLINLDYLSNEDSLNIAWVYNLDAEIQKEYYLSKTIKKESQRIAQLKLAFENLKDLELKIVEEKNKVDYYVHDLKEQLALLSANEQMQKDVLSSNRNERLASLQRIHDLKVSERELESILKDLGVEKSSDLSLAKMRGKLPAPIDGTVLIGFGKSYDKKSNLFTFHKGITIGGSPNTKVKSIASGKVVFAGPLKNYGLVIILEHAGQYYSLYGHLGKLSLVEGDYVEQGMLVGVLDKDPLYFEIRNKNIATNPTQWIVQGNKNYTMNKN